MNTDQGIVTDYQDFLNQNKISLIKEILSDFNEAQVNCFIENIRLPYSVYKTHTRVKLDIPDARDQERYLKKLETKISKLQKFSTELSEQLDDAPFELRHKTSLAQSSITNLQDQLFRFCTVINDIEPKKTKYKSEVYDAIKSIAKAFETCLEIKPKIRAWRSNEEIPDKPVKDDLFIPVLSALLDKGVDQAYRLAKDIA